MTPNAQQGTFRLPDSLAQDLDRFKTEVERLKKGEISGAEFRAFRVPQGVYEQRKEGTFMLRIRFPAGGVLPHQMKALAAVSREHGNGILHVTTRQDIQVHAVPLDHIHPALASLKPAGLSSKGGGGNTVRNITSCYDAGVCDREAFDVSSHAIALTEFLLPDPLSYRLPRKYKIAFAGCAKDCAGVTINDLGFIAKKRGDQLGFAVHVGGGLGAWSRVTEPLQEFAAPGEIHLIAEAVKRVFDQHGNRKNKHKARLRFLIQRIGLERFRALYQAERAKLDKENPSLPQLHELPRREAAAPDAPEPAREGFDAWREKNVFTQKQDGYYLVQIPLQLGDMTADTIEKLADVIGAHGEGMARTTQWQNLVVRWVHENELTALHRKLGELDLARTLPPILRNAIACAGASTCKLGICLSRGVTTAVINKISTDGLNLDGLGEFNLYVSGCPNACGRHPIGHIGLFGAARRVGGRLVPHYIVQVGGTVAEGQTKLAQGKDAVPARDVPAFVADFLAAFQASPQYPDYSAFIEAGGRDAASQLAAKYKQVPAFEEDNSYYFDWGAEVPFSFAGRGPGECGAGVFELIEVDLASAREAYESGKLYPATVLAAHALLVTQGQESREDAEVLRLFGTYFIDKGYVDGSFRGLIEKAAGSAAAQTPEQAFDGDGEQVGALVAAVQHLYDTMDNSLRFQPVAQAEPAAGSCQACVQPSAPSESADEPDVEVHREADFRGVACPLNYVKAKLLLEQMSSGEVLSVLLDDEGARNVPQSAEQDGHKALSVKKQDNAWRVIIQKG